MTERELLFELLEKVSGTIEIVAGQQRHIAAIQKYLSEQPGYNAARFGVIFNEFLTDPERSAKDLKKSQDALTQILKDFKAPPH